MEPSASSSSYDVTVGNLQVAIVQNQYEAQFTAAQNWRDRFKCTRLLRAFPSLALKWIADSGHSETSPVASPYPAPSATEQEGEVPELHRVLVKHLSTGLCNGIVEPRLASLILRSAPSVCVSRCTPREQQLSVSREIFSTVMSHFGVLEFPEMSRVCAHWFERLSPPQGIYQELCISPQLSRKLSLFRLENLLSASNRIQVFHLTLASAYGEFNLRSKVCAHFIARQAEQLVELSVTEKGEGENSSDEQIHWTEVIAEELCKQEAVSVDAQPSGQDSKNAHSIPRLFGPLRTLLSRGHAGSLPKSLVFRKLRHLCLSDVGLAHMVNALRKGEQLTDEDDEEETGTPPMTPFEFPVLETFRVLATPDVPSADNSPSAPFTSRHVLTDLGEFLAVCPEVKETDVELGAGVRRVAPFTALAEVAGKGGLGSCRVLTVRTYHSETQATPWEGILVLCYAMHGLQTLRLDARDPDMEVVPKPRKAPIFRSSKNVLRLGRHLLDGRTDQVTGDLYDSLREAWLNQTKVDMATARSEKQRLSRLEFPALILNSFEDIRAFRLFGVALFKREWERQMGGESQSIDVRVSELVFACQNTEASRERARPAVRRLLRRMIHPERNPDAPRFSASSPPTEVIPASRREWRILTGDRDAPPYIDSDNALWKHWCASFKDERVTNVSRFIWQTDMPEVPEGLLDVEMDELEEDETGDWGVDSDVGGDGGNEEEGGNCPLSPHRALSPPASAPPTAQAASAAPPTTTASNSHPPIIFSSPLDLLWIAGPDGVSALPACFHFDCPVDVFYLSLAAASQSHVDAAARLAETQERLDIKYEARTPTGRPSRRIRSMGSCHSLNQPHAVREFLEAAAFAAWRTRQAPQTAQSLMTPAVGGYLGRGGEGCGGRDDLWGDSPSFNSCSTAAPSAPSTSAPSSSSSSSSSSSVPLGGFRSEPSPQGGRGRVLENGAGWGGPGGSSLGSDGDAQQESPCTPPQAASNRWDPEEGRLSRLHPRPFFKPKKKFSETPRSPMQQPATRIMLEEPAAPPTRPRKRHRIHGAENQDSGRKAVPAPRRVSVESERSVVGLAEALARLKQTSHRKMPGVCGLPHFIPAPPLGDIAPQLYAYSTEDNGYRLHDEVHREQWLAWGEYKQRSGWTRESRRDFRPWCGPSYTPELPSCLTRTGQKFKVRCVDFSSGFALAKAQIQEWNRGWTSKLGMAALQQQGRGSGTRPGLRWVHEASEIVLDVFVPSTAEFLSALDPSQQRTVILKHSLFGKGNGRTVNLMHYKNSAHATSETAELEADFLLQPPQIARVREVLFFLLKDRTDISIKVCTNAVADTIAQVKESNSKDKTKRKRGVSTQVEVIESIPRQKMIWKSSSKKRPTSEYEGVEFHIKHQMRLGPQHEEEPMEDVAVIPTLHQQKKLPPASHCGILAAASIFQQPIFDWKYQDLPQLDAPAPWQRQMEEERMKTERSSAAAVK
uniref:Uncharacterized protein n=1 Tax=Chromera velia CCMP2878 TaxID=1169474 RepID=A0A0G4HC80_9ALVE|eukprot:Cvel_26143.t1-p1 / transcript=Cvel_26143.t1 / gene=Cvel_26143 / organism=Chromera_velia_CCMP2878 / gene_product=hypothetical protein / transcript_product=hypothetical protein / location=Cvel_scaffold3063:10733-16084(-) / protein_length=1466 / sequence_SO=supercontig / SO=protein_coding / is_pseudo=false